MSWRPNSPRYSDVHYGLGFRSHSYRGERVVWHGGGWSGWSTLMTMLPDRGVGVAVFTNRDASAGAGHPRQLCLRPGVRQESRLPWLDRLRERRRKFVAQLDADRQARKASRRPDTRPSHDLADYAGDYDHPGYGRMTITHADSKLQLGVSRHVRAARASPLRYIRAARSGPAACCPTSSPSHFPPTAKETSRSWRLPSSRSSRKSSSSASRPAIAWIQPSARTASAVSARGW